MLSAVSLNAYVLLCGGQLQHVPGLVTGLLCCRSARGLQARFVALPAALPCVDTACFNMLALVLLLSRATACLTRSRVTLQIAACGDPHEVEMWVPFEQVRWFKGLGVLPLAAVWLHLWIRPNTALPVGFDNVGGA